MVVYFCSLCKHPLRPGDIVLTHLSKHLEVSGTDDALKVLACASFGTESAGVATFLDRPRHGHYRNGGARDRRFWATLGLLQTQEESINEGTCTEEEFFKRVIASNRPSALFEEAALAAIGSKVSPVIVEPRAKHRPRATLSIDLLQLEKESREQLDNKRPVRWQRLEGFDDPPGPEGEDGVTQEP